MERSKKTFTLVAILFFALLLYVAYDFSTRTTFPGSGTSKPGRLQDSLSYDSLKKDTLP